MTICSVVSFGSWVVDGTSVLGWCIRTKKIPGITCVIVYVCRACAFAKETVFHCDPVCSGVKRGILTDQVSREGIFPIAAFSPTF